MLPLIILGILFALYFVGKKKDDVATSSTPGADEGVPQPSAGATLATPPSLKTSKVQHMNNTTVHYVKQIGWKKPVGYKTIPLGSIVHAGELKNVTMTADAKDQGRGNKCSYIYLNVTRGDAHLSEEVYVKLLRTSGYTKYTLSLMPSTTTMVEPGDVVSVRIGGSSAGCSAWIKNIKCDVTVFA